MAKIVKMVLILLVSGLMSATFTFAVTTNSDSNSNANVNGGGGQTQPFTPSTTIKNWHEVK